MLALLTPTLTLTLTLTLTVTLTRRVLALLHSAEPSQRPPAAWLHGDAEVVEGEGGPRLRLTTADLASSGSLVLPAGALNASRHEALLKCEAAAVPGRRCPRANPHPHPHPKPKPKPEV